MSQIVLEQFMLGTWLKTGHQGHPIPFVFAQKNNKFQFVANNMRTILKWRSTGSQSYPHIRAFGSWTICEQFANHLVCMCVLGLRPVHKTVLCKCYTTAHNVSLVHSELIFCEHTTDMNYGRCEHVSNIIFNDEIRCAVRKHNLNVRTRLNCAQYSPCVRAKNWHNLVRCIRSSMQTNMHFQKICL